MKRLLPFLLLIVFVELNAQVTLSTSPYTENFDNVGTALPAGFTVKKLATTTTLGTDTALTIAKSAWNGTSRGFKNCASATGLTSAATTTEQDNSTNRALAIRQTGSFCDPGGAFVFQVANTTGFSNFQVSFLLQSLDASSPRVSTWVVDYGIGANPSTFTAVTTTPTPLTTGNSTFSSTTITASFGTSLDNISDVVTIRVYAPAASTGTGNRATTAIDDWSLSFSGTSAINDLFGRDSYVKIVRNTNDAVGLQFNKSINTKISLQLTNMSGQIVFTKAISKVTEGQLEIIPAASLPKGIYFVSILSKEGDFGAKISH